MFGHKDGKIETELNFIIMKLKLLEKKADEMKWKEEPGMPADMVKGLFHTLNEEITKLEKIKNLSGKIHKLIEREYEVT
ncbi:hypothetical protein ACFL0W_00515 [Nanoarchaeota archaeon]